MHSKRGPEHRQAHDVLDSIRRIVRVLRESSRDVELKLGISAAQLFVLESLAKGERLSVNEIARRSFTHQSSASVVIGKLCDRGLVERARAPEDRRRSELVLTRRGRTLLARAPKTAQERLVTGLFELKPGDRASLVRGLGALLETMGLADGAPPMFFEEKTARRRNARS
jgi:DNA-binding MarR family transcriptional regulator